MGVVARSAIVIAVLLALIGVLGAALWFVGDLAARIVVATWLVSLGVGVVVAIVRICVRQHSPLAMYQRRPDVLQRAFGGDPRKLVNWIRHGKTEPREGDEPPPVDDASDDTGARGVNWHM